MNLTYKNISNPYVQIENIANNVSKSNLKYKRRVFRRSVALSIIYTVITFGIYGIFWFFEIAKETNAITRDNKCVTPALVVLLSFITLGIYRIYWAYQVGKKHNNFYLKYFGEEKAFHIIYFILTLLNYIVPLLSIIVYSIMQSKINKMLYAADVENPQGVYVRDSSIFNRPVLSIVLILFICQFITSLVMFIYINCVLSAVDTFTVVSSSSLFSSNLIEQIINNPADQIKYADTPFMIIYSIIYIVVILLILWWFKLRYKNTSYNGVLCGKNFWRAWLISLPGFLFVGLNVLGFDPDYFKWGIVLFAFTPAFLEEITFRGIIIPNFMRLYNRSKGIWLSLIVTSLIFGFSHIVNIFVGANFGTTLFQVFYACSMGLLFASILIRYGNLWPCIVIHGLVDAFGLMTPEALEQGAVQTQVFTFDLGVIILLVLSIVIALYAFWLCRPKKHKEIICIWKEKWGDAIC